MEHPRSKEWKSLQGTVGAAARRTPLCKTRQYPGGMKTRMKYKQIPVECVKLCHLHFNYEKLEQIKPRYRSPRQTSVYQASVCMHNIRQVKLIINELAS